MHCKHCGGQISNDSNFCSICGGKVDPLVGFSGDDHKQSERDFLDNQSKSNLTATNLSKGDKGILFAFVLMVGLRIFWLISGKINEGKSYAEMEDFLKYVVKPSYILFWTIPFILALHISKKNVSHILATIGLIVMGLSVYENYIE